VRPKKKTPDRRGVLLKEQPFTFRQRGDGSVAILWKGRRVQVLTGKLASARPVISLSSHGISGGAVPAEVLLLALVTSIPLAPACVPLFVVRRHLAAIADGRNTAIPARLDTELAAHRMRPRRSRPSSWCNFVM